MTMTMQAPRRLMASVLVVCGLLLGACQSSSHAVGATGKTTVCQECYDAVSAAHRDHPTSTARGVQTLRAYRCPCCNTDMAVYLQDGTPMVKCGGCAPDGVAWDKCAPPEGTAK